MKRREKKEASISIMLPKIDIHQSIVNEENESNSNNASIFVPMHYAKGYAYPLIVWLPGTNTKARKISRVMPSISLRNYFGVSPQMLAGSDSDLENNIFSGIAKVKKRYNICDNRIFIAGCGVGGCHALSLGMKHPNAFAGVISLCGSVPRANSILGSLRTSRKLPVFMSQSRGDAFFSEEDLCNDLKLLHVGGFSVTARQYPGESQLNDQMLHDLDVWIMEIINGFDMTKTDQAVGDWN